MSAKEKAQHIFYELKSHAPFTLLGAVLGLAFMLLFSKTGYEGSRAFFSVFHPAHVVLSAMVTTTIFKLHSIKKNLLIMILVGYFGSVGVATLSDIIIPHIGAHLFELDIPTESKIHQMEHKHTDAADAAHEHEPHKMHFGFIEEWYVVNPAAFLGIAIAYFFPRSKFPHAGHILISTWASSAYLLMDMENQIGLGSAASVFTTLFISVWLPCCLSDIVFPLLFIKTDLQQTGSCPICGKGGHIHI